MCYGNSIKKIEKVCEPKKKLFDIVRVTKAAALIATVVGAKAVDAVSTSRAKDTLNLPQIANGPMEIPKIDHAARAHFEKLGENPDKLVRTMERYTRRKDLSSSRHAIIYDNPCYNHTSGLQDSDVTSHDAVQYYCDTTDPDNNPCGTDITNGNNWYYRMNGPHMVAEIYTELTGDAS
jgi:hypothetical protein